jgi:chromosome segregation ATPase
MRRERPGQRGASSPGMNDIDMTEKRTSRPRPDIVNNPKEENATMATASFTPKMDEHAKLKAQLADIDQALAAAGEQRTSADGKLREASTRRMSAASAVEQRLLMARVSERGAIERAIADDKDVQQAERDAEDAQAAIKEADATDQALMKRHAETRAALLALSGSSLADILSIESQIDAVRAEEAALQTQLDEQRNAVAPELPDLTALDREMTSLMVKVHLGEAQPNELEALEKRRAAALKKHDEAASVSEHHAALIAGLKERIDEARGRLPSLDEQKRIAMVCHCRDELEQAASVYRDAAQCMFDAHGRMTAFARLASDLDSEMAREITAKHSPALRTNLKICVQGDLTLADTPDHRAQAFTEVLEQLRVAGVRM